jgi:cysteinyl-tRNA synthetase
MKRWIVMMIILLQINAVSNSYGQEQEAQQLLFNVQKLAQLKKILNNMYDGYRTISKGYNTVRDIANGNFSLHEAFLDKLLQVSPAIRNYYKVAAVIKAQSRIVSEYKQAFRFMKESNFFEVKEIQYAGRVYKQLFDRSVRSLDELLTVLTASTLRMSDEERLSAIDNIFDDVTEQLQFLRVFNNDSKLVSLQRNKERVEVEASKSIQGLK